MKKYEIHIIKKKFKREKIIKNKWEEVTQSEMMKWRSILQINIWGMRHLEKT